MITLFFELIKVAVKNREQLSRTPSSLEWKQLYETAKQQALIGVLYTAVERLPKEQHPPTPILMEWYAMTEKIKLYSKINSQACVEVQKKFSAEGFRTCILKGQGLAALYDAPLYRQSGDIDVWVVPISNQSFFVDSLSERRKKIVKYVRKKTPKAEYIYHHIKHPKCNDIEVEVHFTPSGMYNFFDNQKLQSWFERQAPLQFQNSVDISTQEEKQRITVPTLYFNVVFVLSHIYRHLFAEGIGLRQVMDYYYVVKLFSQQIDEKKHIEICKDLKRVNLLTFAKSMMWVLNEVFGLDESYMICEPDERSGQLLLNEIMRVGNFGQYDVRRSRSLVRGSFASFWNIVTKNMRYLRYYPAETLWNPLFKIGHRIWLCCFPIR